MSSLVYRDNIEESYFYKVKENQIISSEERIFEIIGLFEEIGNLNIRTKGLILNLIEKSTFLNVGKINLIEIVNRLVLIDYSIVDSPIVLNSFCRTIGNIVCIVYKSIGELLITPTNFRNDSFGINIFMSIIHQMKEMVNVSCSIPNFDPIKSFRNCCLAEFISYAYEYMNIDSFLGISLLNECIRYGQREYDLVSPIVLSDSIIEIFIMKNPLCVIRDNMNTESFILFEAILRCFLLIIRTTNCQQLNSRFLLPEIQMLIIDLIRNEKIFENFIYVSIFSKCIEAIEPISNDFPFDTMIENILNETKNVFFDHYSNSLSLISSIIKLYNRFVVYSKSHTFDYLLMDLFRSIIGFHIDMIHDSKSTIFGVLDNPEHFINVLKLFWCNIDADIIFDIFMDINYQFGDESDQLECAIFGLCLNSIFMSWTNQIDKDFFISCINKIVKIVNDLNNFYTEFGSVLFVENVYLNLLIKIVLLSYSSITMSNVFSFCDVPEGYDSLFDLILNHFFICLHYNQTIPIVCDSIELLLNERNSEEWILSSNFPKLIIESFTTFPQHSRFFSLVSSLIQREPQLFFLLKKGVFPMKLSNSNYLSFIELYKQLFNQNWDPIIWMNIYIMFTDHFNSQFKLSINPHTIDLYRSIVHSFPKHSAFDHLKGDGFRVFLNLFNILRNYKIIGENHVDTFRNLEYVTESLNCLLKCPFGSIGIMQMYNDNSVYDYFVNIINTVESLRPHQLLRFPSFLIAFSELISILYPIFRNLIPANLYSFFIEMSRFMLFGDNQLFNKGILLSLALISNNCVSDFRNHFGLALSGILSGKDPYYASSLVETFIENDTDFVFEATAQISNSYRGSQHIRNIKEIISLIYSDDLPSIQRFIQIQNICKSCNLRIDLIPFFEPFYNSIH